MDIGTLEKLDDNRWRIPRADGMRVPDRWGRLRLLLQPALDERLSEQAVTRAIRELRAMMATTKPDRRLAESRRLVVEGVLSKEEAVAVMERLRPAEDVPAPYPFGTAAACREVVRTLRDSLAVDSTAAARPLLRDLIGPITTIPTESDGERCLAAHFPAFSAEARLVAGGRSQRYQALVTAFDILSSAPCSKAVRATPSAP